jgi:hypothetical protein
VTPAQIGRKCPENRPGVSVSPTTVVRWITEGVRLRAGGRLKLPATRYPGGWRIAEEDFAQFIAMLTSDRTGSVTPPPGAEVRAEAAMARMAARGFRTNGA